MTRKIKNDSSTPITAYKGFDKDLKCRGFQYEIGQTVELADGEPARCTSQGFHACEHPLNALAYYPPATSRYASVELSGSIDRGDGTDTKLCAARLSVTAEIQLPELIEAAVKWVFARAKWSEGPVATTNHEGVTASGWYGAATASGESGAATASGWYGAATASGWYGAATASGWSGAATADHKTATAHASNNGRARGVEGSALHLDERNIDGEIIHVWAGIVGRDGIKPNTFYALEDGKPVEVSS